MFNRSTTAGAAGDRAVPPLSPQELSQPPRRQSSLSANSSVFYPSSHYSTSSSISVSTPQTPTTPSLSNILGLSTTDTGTGQSVKTFQCGEFKFPDVSSPLNKILSRPPRNRVCFSNSDAAGTDYAGYGGGGCATATGGYNVVNNNGLN